MATTPRADGGTGSGSGGRNHNITGGIKHDLPRPRFNVKFTVGDGEEQLTAPEPQSLQTPHIPEIDVTESPNLPPLDDEQWIRRKDEAALVAHNKANRHAFKVKKHNSAPNSRRSSFDQSSTAVGSPGVISPYTSPPQKPASNIRLDDIPLENLEKPLRQFDIQDDTSENDDEDDDENQLQPKLARAETHHVSEAKRLMRTFTFGDGSIFPDRRPQSGTATPLTDQQSHEYDYVPRPTKYKKSVLSHLLAAQSHASRPAPHSIHRDAQEQQMDYISDKLQKFQGQDDVRKKDPDYFRRSWKQTSKSPGSVSGTQTPLDGSGGGSSGTMTPRAKRPKWYKNTRGEWNCTADSSVAKLMEASNLAAIAPATPGTSTQPAGRPTLKRNSSSRASLTDSLKHPFRHIRQASSSINLNKHSDYDVGALADRLASQEYIIEMCKALMAYGAPTHRLEEFLGMAARRLCIQASFQYLPNCMVMSFDDPETHTTELKLIKEPTTIDLGKLLEVQHVYKNVMHNNYSIADAMDEIRDIRNRRKKYGKSLLITCYGLAAVSVGPFAFSARPIDLPINFLLGCILGALQLDLATRSIQFSHIFEVFGTCATSFLARGFGSIMFNGTPIFCFSALAQSSIALILPGWIILSAALELQSRNIIAGSIRMVYAIIYTLFLGFGILIGTTVMGLIYPDATNDITCAMPDYWDAGTSWKLIYTKFVWVPIFTVCLAIISQAKWKQMPWMIFISFVGYQVNYWSTLRFSQNIQVANALGALAIGFLANGYSRFKHGVAAATMLPAIFVMVPSGLAASGSLVAGLTSANQITHNVSGISIINNGTQGFYDAQNTTTSASSSVYGGTIFYVGYGMVQVAIGISVGLFLSALLIYPFGKKRSGIFSF